MDAIRIPKVEAVSYTKSGVTSLGTLHLTAHHLIFRWDDASIAELWVPYPLISLVTRLPQSLKGESPLSFETRTFDHFNLTFTRDSDAGDVFESVKELTVATSVSQLYAYFYNPNPPLPKKEGWSLYSPKQEFSRMGVGTRTKEWRFTTLNYEYSFCPTYPALLVVPSKISDTTLQYASKYRSKCRIPALSYLHWANFGSITRSSQPMVGITQNRSVQDEKLIESIFQSHNSPNHRSGPVYGATTTNLIIDARPTTNAVANTAKGAGTENMDHYRDAKKAYLGIDNIHVMRESLGKVVEVLREADSFLASISPDLHSRLTGVPTLDRAALRRTGWLRHIATILEGSLLITRNVHINSSHVLIHCSDGWDRTSQLSAIAQLCLDPYYRTIRGFEILIEKDWLSFGYKFLDRSGHLSSEKCFVSNSENVSGADAAQAFLASVQNRFAGQQHLRETSPVFHQFLDAVRQIQRQFPERFEFSERFLRQIYYHLYSCQFGTFLYNCERDRRVGDGGIAPVERTYSVWDFLNSPEEMEKNHNPTYDASLDDSKRPKADMGVLLPNSKDVRFWYELFGRTDEEMNGKTSASLVKNVDAVGPIEEPSSQDITLPLSTSALSNPLSPPKSPLLSQSVQMNVPSSSSPSIAGFVSDLSASLPNIPVSLAFRTDGFRAGSPSSNIIKPTGTGAQTTQSPAQTYTSGTASKSPEYLAGAGVKSMWGRFSSNASAAFSVVQEAYVGVAENIRGTNPDENPLPASTTPDSTSSERTGELQTRDTLNSWAAPATSARRLTLPSPGVEYNPWSTGSIRSASTKNPYENPWGNPVNAAGRSPPIQTTGVTDVNTPRTDAHSLDRTISDPADPLTTQSYDSMIPSQDIVRGNILTSSPKESSNFDPLGVGL